MKQKPEAQGSGVGGASNVKSMPCKTKEAKAKRRAERSKKRIMYIKMKCLISTYIPTPHHFGARRRLQHLSNVLIKAHFATLCSWDTINTGPRDPNSVQLRGRLNFFFSSPRSVHAWCFQTILNTNIFGSSKGLICVLST